MKSRKKVIFVGAKGCGKTCLFKCISGEVFDSLHVPTISKENCQKDISVNGKKVIIVFLITSGKCVKKLRVVSYFFALFIAVKTLRHNWWRKLWF
jgi:GTPase SAR1 family protein